jgi:hypothetical protein
VKLSGLKQWITNRLLWLDANMSSVITGVENEQNQLQLFPNPFENSVTIQTHNDHLVKRLQVLDMTGREVFHTLFSEDEYQWEG